jgi:hypothetical protein
MNLASATSRRLPRIGALYPVVLRFVWKEHRSLRGLMFGVALTATAILALAIWLLPAGALEAIQVAVPWGAGALYTVGAAISLFAVERDGQTNGFLVLLPRHERSMLVGKVLAAAFTSQVLIALLGLVGVLLAGGRLPSWEFATSASASGLLIVVEWLVWGIAASLLCPHSLLAPVLAIAAAMLGAELAFASTSAPELSVWLADGNIAAPQRLLLVAAIAALDIRLGLRWLDPRPRRGLKQTHAPSISRTSKLSQQAARSNAANQVSTQSRSLSWVPSAIPMFRRLVWQSWREGWAPMLAIIPTGMFLTAAFSAVAIGIAHATSSASAAPLGWLIIPALCGALVFRGDQLAQQHAFLNAHAARPAVVWTARQAMALTSLLVIGFTLNVILLRGSALGWSAMLAAYGCGQLCSMTIRSSVLAGIAAIGFSIVVAAWSNIVGLWQLPAPWFVGSVGLATLAFTLVGCRGWLADLTGARRWRPPASALATGLALLTLTLPMARWAQVVVEEPSIRSAMLAQALEQWRHEQSAAQTVAADYRRLNAAVMQNLTDAAADSANVAERAAFLQACQPEFDELARLSQSPRCRLSPAPAGAADRAAMISLINWLLDDAARQQEAGELPSALERLMTARRMAAHTAQYQALVWPTGATEVAAAERTEAQLASWCVAAGQTVELLTDAIRQLCDCEQLQPALSERVIADYLRIRAQLASGNIAVDQLTSQSATARSEAIVHLASIAHRLPGERSRALAALKHMTEARLAYVEAIAPWQSQVAWKPQPLQHIANQRWLLHPSVDVSAGLSRTPRVATDLSRTLDASETSFLPALALSQGGSMVDATALALEALARRREEIIRVALIAHKLGKGHYPESLTVLTTNDDQGRITLSNETILDPFTGATFEYRPQGLDHPILRPEDKTLAAMIPAGTPLLWSVGQAFEWPRDVWVAERQLEDGHTAIIRANDPSRFPPPEFGDTPVHVIKFTMGTDFIARGPVLLVLPNDRGRGRP